MAIVSSYPNAENISVNDSLLGTHFKESGTQTRSFPISDILALVPDTPIPTLQQVITSGATGNIPISINTTLNGQTAISGIVLDLDDSRGVYGYSVNGTGVQGESPSGRGLYGVSVAGRGVEGYSDSNDALYGSSYTGRGVRGSSYGSYGVQAESFNGIGIYASSVNGTAAVKPGGGSWAAPSDSRVKENILPYTKGLAEVILINPVTYDYNGLGGMPKSTGYTGIIAQDLQDIFPETIKVVPGKLNETDTEDTDLLIFDGNALTYALINAVKELKAEIELLKVK